MKKLITIILTLFLSSYSLAAEKNIITDLFYTKLALSFQNWSKIGMVDDSKMGFGFSGSFGIKQNIDDLTIMPGILFSSNSWSADYSNKPNSATDLVTVSMDDFGLTLISLFSDGTFIELKTGESVLSSAMIINGKEYPYSFNKTKYNFNGFEIGIAMDKDKRYFFGVGIINYSGYANNCDRVEFSGSLLF